MKFKLFLFLISVSMQIMVTELDRLRKDFYLSYMNVFNPKAAVLKNLYIKRGKPYSKLHFYSTLLI
jgi:hypothetical protein